MKALLSKRNLVVFSAVAAFAAIVVGTAGAVPTVPTVDVASYGDQLLSTLGTQLTAVLPYAAAITAFGIAVGMLRRWLGHKKATRI